MGNLFCIIFNNTEIVWFLLDVYMLFIIGFMFCIIWYVILNNADFFDYKWKFIKNKENMNCLFTNVRSILFNDYNVIVYNNSSVMMVILISITIIIMGIKVLE